MQASNTACRKLRWTGHRERMSWFRMFTLRVDGGVRREDDHQGQCNRRLDFSKQAFSHNFRTKTNIIAQVISSSLMFLISFYTIMKK